MASSETIVTSSQQQTTTDPPTSIVYTSTTTSKRDWPSAVDEKAKTSPSASSGAKSRVEPLSDEEWDEEYGGKLVIDLGNDTESEKKEAAKTPQNSASGDRNPTPVRNNNNNNSHSASSPSKDKTYISAASSVAVKSGTPFSTSPAVSSSKNGGKSKSKKSSKSSSKHHHNQGNASYNSSTHLTSGSFRTSSPITGDNLGGSSDITSLSSTNKHAGLYTAAADTKTPAVFTATARSSSSPDDVTGKKSKSSKSGRSHHKKHKHDKNSSERSHVGGSKGEERAKSKNKQHNSASSLHSVLTQSNALTLTTASNSQFASNHSSISSAKFRQANSPGLSGFGNGIASHSSKYPTQAASHGRTPARTAAVTGSETGSKATHSNADKDNTLVDGHTSHHNRKKPRKSLVASTQAQLTTQPLTTSEVDPQRYRGYGVQQHLSSSVVGKRDRSGNSSSAQPCANDSIASKKIKLEQENKEGGNFNNDSSVSALTDASTQSKQQNATDTTSNEQQNSAADAGKTVKQIAGTKTGDSAGPGFGPTPPIFPQSTLFNSRFHTSGASAHNSAPTTPQPTSTRSGSNDDNKKGLGLDSQRSVGTLTLMSDVGVMTEPDSLGPCEPGTSVHLEGIVWHETDTGVLVVNVTWRNRTYVGTLLDATKHDWAPPRLSDTDLDMELRGKNGRPKRQRGSTNESAASTRKGRSRAGTQAMNDELKGSPSTSSKRRGNKNSESESNLDNDGSSTPRSSAKRARLGSSRNNITQQLQMIQNEATGNKEVTAATASSNGAGSGSSTCSSPVFIDCPHPKCNKRYKHINGLKYHQSHAHLGLDGEQKEEGKENSDRDNDKMSDDGEAIPLAEATEKLAPISPVKNLAEKDESADIKTEMSGDVSKKVDESPAVVTSEMGRDNFAQTKQTPVFPSESYSNPQKPQPVVRRPTEASSAHKINTNGNFPSVDARNAMEVSAADSESAMAVQTLLQLQPQDDQFLPGLTTPYSQDSPPPTLSLASRPGTISEPNHSSYGSHYQQHVYSASKSAHPTPGTQEQISQGFENRPIPTSSVEISQNTFPANKFNAQPNSVHPTSEHQRPEKSNFSGVTQIATKDNYAPSVSSPVTLPSGNKMAKGKTVPIPLDPNHGVNPPLNNADATSPGSNSAKKQKRKKKLDQRNSSGTNEGTPERRRQSNEDESAPNKPKPPAMESNPPPHSFPVQAGMAMPNPHAPKPQLPPPMIDQSPAIIKTEPGVRPTQQFPQQPSYQVGRKLPGVVMPISSAGNPGSNNITVAGTFVPFPDPHHPQTAVSAQTQDRLRATRNPSPTNVASKGAIKPPGSLGTNPVRPQPEPKLRSSVPVPARGIHPEMQSHIPSEHDSAHHSRIRHPPDSKLRANEHQTIGKLQDKVDSTIANVYNSSSRQQTPRSKPPTPLPEQLRPHEGARPRPITPNEPRPDEHRSRPHTPPRLPLDVPAELRERPGSPHLPGKPPVAPHFSPQAQQAQVAYYQRIQQQMYLSGLPQYGIIAPQQFDPNFDVRQQYEKYFQQQQQIYVQEMHHQHQHQQKQQHLHQLQQQQQQQQQLDRKIRKESIVKDIPKVEFPHKQNSPAEPGNEKHAMWPAHHAKRHSTGSLSPYPNQAIREKQPGVHPPPEHHPSPSGSRPVYKTPQPNTPTQNRSHSVANHPSLPPSSSPSVHGVRPEMRRGDVPREDPGSHPARKQITPPSVRERSPEKPKEGIPPGGVYRSPAASPGHLQFYPAAAPGFPHPNMFEHARPPFRGFAVPGFSPGYVYPQAGAPIYSAQPGWSPTGPIPPGKQSPPLKPTKERSPSANRSPREEIRRLPDGKPKENPVHFNKERRPIEAVSARKISRSPDPKQVAQTNAPGRPLVSKSPPTQHHTHHHHHIHEGIPFTPILPANHFPYTAPIAAPVIAASSEGVPYPAGFNQKRE